MATHAEVKAQLDQVSGIIDEAAKARAQGKAALLRARSLLADIPASYTDLQTTVNGYTPTGAFETLAKDEFAKLIADRGTMQTAVEAELTAISVPF